MGVPGVKAHAAGFELGGTFGKPQGLQGEGDHGGKVADDPFVVVVCVAELEPIKIGGQLGAAFDAYQVAEFVGNHVGDPAVATADLEIPVGEPQVDGILSRNGGAVAVQSVVQHSANAGEGLVVTGDNGVIDRLGIGRYRRGVVRVFGGIDELEMFRACGFPVDVALVAVKTGRQCGTRKHEQCA